MSRTTDLRVTCVNDIAYILETVTPILRQRGIELSVLGRRAGDPDLGRESFVRNVMQIQSGLANGPDFDILHLNYALFGFLGFQTDRPVILHCHGSDVRPGRSLKARAVNTISRISMRAATRVWYSTTDLAGYFRGSKIPHRYMPNPVSGRFFQGPEERPRRNNILFAVPLSRLKGADIAIQAMQILSRREGVHISAFGYDPKVGDSASLSDSIPRSVRLLPWTPHDGMPGLLSGADVVVGRLRLGSLGITELEAMASARPVIAHQQGSVRELVGYYQTEPPILCCDSAEEVADAVMHCLDDDAFAADLAARSREWVRQHHSAEAVADLYEIEYRELAGVAI